MKLHVLSGGAAQGLVASQAAAFEAATGLAIEGTFGAIGAMKARLLAGADADLVILSQPMVSELEAQGHVAAGSAVDIGVVHTGIAARAGDPIPAIGDASTLREALRGADAIYFPDPANATAGIHFAKVLHQLGVAAELADRLKSFPNGHAAMTAMATQQGGRPIGCTQATEILGTKGVVLAGLLPHGLELATVYTAAVAARAASPDAARRLAGMMAARAAAALRARLGFTEVG